jgi:hypothetical protein
VTGPIDAARASQERISRFADGRGGSYTDMFGFEWRRPVGLDTMARDCHTVLVVTSTAADGQHLLDVARLVDSDPRIKVAFTADSDMFDRGIERHLNDVDAVLVPWQRATTEDFGVAIATGFRAIRRVRAPSIVMPFGERMDIAVMREARGLRCTTGPHRVIHRCGAGPASIVLSHERDLARLTRAYPETRAVATVAGNPTYDRLTASLPLRAFYRRTMGVGAGQRLVVVIATYAAHSRDLLVRLLGELPPEKYRVVALFQPDGWPEPGAGLADCLRRGLTVMPPEGDWRSALVAADWIIDDHGAIGPYGTIIGVPVLLSEVLPEDTAPDSPLAELARVAPRLSPHRPVREQLDWAAATHRPELHQAVRNRITSEPGRFNRNIRSLMYRILRLRQPLTIPTTDPVSPPFRID